MRAFSLPFTPTRLFLPPLLSPDPLLFCFPSEKSMPPKDINWIQHNKVQ